MESHAAITAKLLGQMAFSKHYKHVPEWAAAHHELLDGTGYPNGLANDAIPPEVRLLTILDVFDALTAADRPYKPALPTERALAVLDAMAEDGRLDASLLSLFKACEPWSARGEEATE
jgi:HD-GYP domain-containing protein (c-di-GMP phosphodiesterase class II)